MNKQTTSPNMFLFYKTEEGKMKFLHKGTEDKNNILFIWKEGTIGALAFPEEIMDQVLQTLKNEGQLNIKTIEVGDVSEIKNL